MLPRWKHRPCPKDALVWWGSQTGKQTSAAQGGEDSDGGESGELRSHRGGGSWKRDQHKGGRTRHVQGTARSPVLRERGGRACASGRAGSHAQSEGSAEPRGCNKDGDVIGLGPENAPCSWSRGGQAVGRPQERCKTGRRIITNQRTGS